MAYETYETLLDQITDPTNCNIDWEKTNSFCDLVNRDLDGPAISTRYLIRKLQSEEERTQVLALCVVDACVRHCGRRFHAEIGKYKFLNELIKLLSPKYRGNKTTLTVKKKIVDLMERWNVGLPSEAKIGEAYKMLKDQGLTTFNNDGSRTEDTAPKKDVPELFDDEKSKLLSRLLKSSHPEDLQAANRLIKNMVRQDEMRMERLQKRIQELETCGNNVKLLSEMLNQFSSATEQDKELMKELYLSCDKMRPQLFRLASQATEDGDECLAEILKANDDLSKVLEDYRAKLGIESPPPQPQVSQEQSNAPTSQPITSNPTLASAAGATPSQNESTLIDLGASSPTKTAAQTPEATGKSILEDQLKALGLDSPTHTTKSNQVTDAWGSLGAATSQTPWGTSSASSPFQGGTTTTGFANFGAPDLTTTSSPLGAMGVRPSVPAGPSPNMMGPNHGPGGVPVIRGLFSGTSSVVNRVPGNEEPKKKVNPLDLLGQEVLNKEKEKTQKQELSVDLTQNSNEQLLPTSQAKDASLLQTNILPPAQLTADSLLNAAPPAAFPAVQPATVSAASRPATLSLDDVFVPLDKIKPGTLPPLNAYDKNGIKTVFHFAKDTSENSRPDVLVIVVSTMSTSSSEVKNFIFQAAVPKTMKVKLQPPSSTELPAHNPILPPSAITQVMLIANPIKEKIRLRHRICYEINGSTVTDSADIEEFPVQ